MAASFKLDGCFCNGQPIGSGLYEILRCKRRPIDLALPPFELTTDYPELTKSCDAALSRPELASACTTLTGSVIMMAFRG